ncbi:MAG: hypothetical protein JOY71_29745 [Acetobacteraceae bacterium]|nr:hypothetical protein [Acetobacteraceae bacterium]
MNALSEMRTIHICVVVQRHLCAGRTRRHDKKLYGNLRQACGLVDLVGRNTARIELHEAATQSGRRYENGDAAAQRLGSHRALR